MNGQEIELLKEIREKIVGDVPKIRMIEIIDSMIKDILEYTPEEYILLREDGRDMIIKGTSLEHCDVTGKAVILIKEYYFGIPEIVAICSPNDTIIKK